MNGLPALRYIMSIIIVSSDQHCDEQQFQTLSCALYTIFFSVIKLDLVIQALLLDYILALENKCVRLACILFLYRNQYFLTFLGQNIQQKIPVCHIVFSWDHAPNPVASVQIQY